MFRRRYLAVVSVLILACGLALTACGATRHEDDNTLVVWSLQVQPERVAITKQAAARFTEQTGISVEIVPIEEAQVAQLLAAAALSREMPDVIGSVSLGLTRSFDQDGFLDRAAATQVVNDLGRDTWSDTSLGLSSDDGQQLSVPSDGWGQILVYRKDLFAQAGLAPPDTYENLLRAAETLTRDGTYGISLATDPSDPFTQQTFESLALGNNCQLLNDQGAPTMDSKACATTIDFYGQLATKYSPAGTQTVDTTRAAYFSGQVAMTMWSTFLLDELAGLRNDALPTCDECAASPTWLAENTGVLPLVTGPDAKGQARSYGEITSWVVTSSASTSDSTEFVKFMMSDGYEQWLSMAPEGKFPVRQGTRENPTEYVDAWSTMDAGVDTRKNLAEVYPPETIETLQTAPSNIGRWAITQGFGRYIGPLTAELPFAKAIADMGSGGLTAADAQAEMQATTKDITER
ncbi:carbohydrate ABC transporter substrate-binding protein [Micrococcales bacterium 31B]|nr:carbohydrate ABC transporter substrate-binding protein [Micrococcales bacterium 31B]